jgi:hypothetical protein
VSDTEKWQPVLLILDRRLECKCGSLATIVVGSVSDTNDTYNILDDVDVWCQECFSREQEEMSHD